MVVEQQLVALADPTRRSIFELIRARPTSVRELSDQLPISQPAVSQHLRVLREAALAQRTSVGSRNIYSVDPAGVSALKEWIDSTWHDVLDAFAEAADHEARKKKEIGES